MKHILLILTLLIFAGKAAQAWLSVPVATAKTWNVAVDDQAEKESEKEKKVICDELPAGNDLEVASCCLEMFFSPGTTFFASPFLEMHVPPPDNK